MSVRKEVGNPTAFWQVGERETPLTLWVSVVLRINIVKGLKLFILQLRILLFYLSVFLRPVHCFPKGSYWYVNVSGACSVHRGLLVVGASFLFCFVVTSCCSHHQKPSARTLKPLTQSFDFVEVPQMSPIEHLSQSLTLEIGSHGLRLACLW